MSAGQDSNTHDPHESQIWPSEHAPQEPPQPSSPHVRVSEQSGVQQSPSWQISPGGQVPAVQLQ
jgi:hypothetical protein